MLAKANKPMWGLSPNRDTYLKNNERNKDSGDTMKHNKTQIYEITDHTRNKTKTLVVQHNTSDEAAEYIVTKTVEEEVHITDIVNKINKFDDLHAEAQKREIRTVTSESDKK